jgi:DNA-binding beta-propeller fold protein YncE
MPAPRIASGHRRARAMSGPSAQTNAPWLDPSPQAEYDTRVDDLASGTEFAGYRIEAVAGRGGMGVVYRATQLGLDRPVALKVIAAGLLGDQRVRERFLRESRAAAAIEHPNVIPIHASGEFLGLPYIAMRFVEGDDLREQIAGGGPLDPARAAAIVAQVGAALDAAHEAGLVHRDVKPANILLGAHDHVYLSDFGLARHALSDPGLTAPGAWVGTLDFVAPEQIRGAGVDGRADVYALGCVLHFALTGQPPYPREADEARLWAHLHAAPPEPSRIARGIPPAFDAVVRRALEKRPEARQASAGELGNAAVQAAAGIAPATHRKLAGAARQRRASATEATWPDAPSPRRRRPAAISAAIVVAAAVGAAAAVLFANGGTDHSPATSAAAQTTTAVRARPVAAPHVVRTVHVGRAPINVEVAGGSAWVASTGSPWLGRVMVRGVRRAHGPRLGLGISDIAARRGELWITVAQSRSVVRVRAKTGNTIGHPIAMLGQPRAIDAGEGAVWVAEQSAAGPDHLVEIDPHTATVVGRLAVPEGINDIRAADGAVWVLGRRAPNLIKVSAPSLQPIARIPVGEKPLRVAVAMGYVWVTNNGDNSVSRVDPKGPHVATIGVPSKPYGLHARADGIWVACYGDQSVVRIDPRTSRVAGDPIPVGLNPIGVDVAHGSLWVTNSTDRTVTRIDLR